MNWKNQDTCYSPGIKPTSADLSSEHHYLPNPAECAPIFGNHARHLSDDECAHLGERSEGLSGRTVKDICEFTERRWARNVLVKKLEPTAPPFDYYRHSLRLWKEGK